MNRFIIATIFAVMKCYFEVCSFHNINNIWQVYQDFGFIIIEQWFAEIFSFWWKAKNIAIILLPAYFS